MSLPKLGVVCFVVTSVMLDVAAQGVDFSGRWKVNHSAGNPPSQSNSEQIWEITQTPSELRLRVVVNGREVSLYTWPLGGPAISTRRDGLDSMTTATLQQSALLISGKSVAGAGVETDLEEHWAIDATSKALRVAKVLRTDATTFRREIVLERVP